MAAQQPVLPCDWAVALMECDVDPKSWAHLLRVSPQQRICVPIPIQSVARAEGVARGTNRTGGTREQSHGHGTETPCDKWACKLQTDTRETFRTRPQTSVIPHQYPVLNHPFQQRTWRHSRCRCSTPACCLELQIRLRQNRFPICQCGPLAGNCIDGAMGAPRPSSVTWGLLVGY